MTQKTYWDFLKVSLSSMGEAKQQYWETKPQLWWVYDWMVVDGLQSQHKHYHFCDRFESGMSDVFLYLGLCALPRIDIMTY